MMPIGPWMMEHRLMERMIHVLKEELALIERNGEVDRKLIHEEYQNKVLAAEKNLRVKRL